MAALALKVTEHLESGFVFRHQQDFVHDLRETNLRLSWASHCCRSAEVEQPGEIARIDRADDELGPARLVVDRDARKVAAEDARAGIFKQHPGGEREDFLT